MSHVRKTLGEAVRTVVESLEKRILLSSVMLQAQGGGNAFAATLNNSTNSVDFSVNGTVIQSVAKTQVDRLVLVDSGPDSSFEIDAPGVSVTLDTADADSVYVTTLKGNVVIDSTQYVAGIDTVYGSGVVLTGSSANLHTNYVSGSGRFDHLGGTLHTSQITIESSGVFNEAGGTISSVAGLNVYNSSGGTFKAGFGGALANISGSFVNYGHIISDVGGGNTATVGMQYSGVTNSFNLVSGTLRFSNGFIANSGLQIDGTGGTLSVPAYQVKNGAVTQSGGTFYVDGECRVGQTGSGTTSAGYSITGGKLEANTLLLADSNVTSSFSQSGGTVVVNAANIGVYSKGVNWSMTGGSLTATSLGVGQFTTSASTLNFSGGTIAAGNSIFSADSQVTVNVSQAASFGASGQTRIGAGGGTATFNQTGGAVYFNDLHLASAYNSTGVYNLSGGTLTTGGIYLTKAADWAGDTQHATFNQTGGTHTNNWMVVGEAPNGTAKYSLNGGTLVGAWFFMAGGTSPEFSQTAGQASFSQFFVGSGGNTEAKYKLSGGSLFVDWAAVTGYSSAGRFEQSGGTSTFNRGLTVSGNGVDGQNSSGQGTLTLSGNGFLTTPTVLVGYGTNGSFHQSGGNLQIGDKLIKNGPSGTIGTVTLTGGTRNAYTTIDVLVPSATGSPTVPEGSPYNLGLIATSDVGYNAITSWSVNWDDVASPGLQNIAGSPAGVQHTYYAGGQSHAIQATAFGGGKSYPTAPKSVLVTNAAPVITPLATITVSAGVAVNLLAAFTEPGTGQTHTAAIGWGDGAVSSTQAGNLTLTESGQSGTVAGTHTFNTHGTYTATVYVTDSLGGVSSRTVTIEVMYVQPQFAISAIPSPVVAQQAVQVQMSAAGADANGVTQWYVDWGDGTTGTYSDAAVVASPTLAVWQKSHTYAHAGNYTIHARATDSEGQHEPVTFALTVLNAPPTILQSAAANSSTVTGTSAQLSVLGSDENGESGLTYSWAVDQKPAGATDPTFSVNGTNTAKNSTVTFSAAGTYGFTVTVSDGVASTTSSVQLTVQQTLTTIDVSPAVAAVGIGLDQQLTAIGKDQFGDPLATIIPVSWSIANGVGTVSSTGLFTSPTGGNATVRATSATTNTIYGDASITVSDSAPTVVNPATASTSPVTGTAVTLQTLGSDDGGESNLTYIWSVIQRPSGALLPTFSRNGTNAANSTSVTFSKAGQYSFLVTMSDGALGATSLVNVTVSATPTSLSVAAAVPSVASGHQAAFTVTLSDQFGNAIPSPSITWTVLSGGGSFNSNILTAAMAGTTTVQAQSAGITATTQITVTNSAPTVSIAKDTGNQYVTGKPLGFDAVASDPDGGGLTYAWSVWQNGAPISVAGSFNGAHVNFTASNEGDYEIRLAVEDAGGATSTASALIEVGEDNGTVAVTDDIIARSGSAMIQLNVLANDILPAGTTASVVAVTQPAHGTAQIGGSGGYQISFTPGQGFSGTDSFIYTLLDNHGIQRSAVVNLNLLNAGAAITPGSSDGLQDYTINEGHYVNPRTAFYPTSRGNFRFTTTVAINTSGAVSNGQFGSLNGIGITSQTITVILSQTPSDAWGYTEFLTSAAVLNTTSSSNPTFKGHELTNNTYTFSAEGDATSSAYSLYGTASSGGGGDVVQDGTTLNWSISGNKTANIGNASNVQTGSVYPSFSQSGTDRYSASGISDYQYDVPGGSVDGINTQSATWVGHYGYTILDGSYILTESSGWSYDGTGESTQSTSESGTTTATPFQSHVNSSSTTSGLTESGYGSSDSRYTVYAEWSPNGWEKTSGIGDAYQVQHGDSTVTSHGTYSHVTLGGAESSSVHGNTTASQTDLWDSNTSIDQIYNGALWVITAGTGEAYGDNRVTSSYQGEGNYSRPDTTATGTITNSSSSSNTGTPPFGDPGDGETLTATIAGSTVGSFSNISSDKHGSTAENGSDDSTTSYSINSDWASSGWISTGSTDTRSDSDGTYSVTGSSSYSHVTTSPTYQSNTETISGSTLYTSVSGEAGVSETNDWGSHNTLHQTLGSDGSWTVASGGGYVTGSDTITSSYDGTGTYTQDDGTRGISVSADGSITATFINSGSSSGPSQESGNDSTTTSYTINTDWVSGAWVDTGSSSSDSGSSGTITSEGGGRYTHSAWAGDTTSTSGGTTHKSQSNRWSSDDILAMELGADGSWVVASGDDGTTGTMAVTSTYSGSGTTTQDDSSEAGTLTGTSSGNYAKIVSNRVGITAESGTTSYKTKYDTQSDWNDGSWTSTGTSDQENRDNGTWDSVGTADYTHHTVSADSTLSVVGTIGKKQTTTWDSNGSIHQSLGTGGTWATTAGSITYAGKSEISSSYQGTGILSLHDINSTTTTSFATGIDSYVGQVGTVKEKGTTAFNSSYTVVSAWSGNSWSNTGTSGYTGSSSGDTSSTVSGTYSHATAALDGTSNSSVAGPSRIKHTNVWNSTDEGKQKLGSDGSWTFTSGNSTYTGNDHTDSSYSNSIGTIHSASASPSSVTAYSNTGSSDGTINEHLSKTYDATYSINSSWNTATSRWTTTGLSTATSVEDGYNKLTSTGVYTHTTAASTDSYGNAVPSSTVSGDTTNTHDVVWHSDSKLPETLNASGTWVVSTSQAIANSNGSDNNVGNYNGNGTYSDGRSITENGTNSLKTTYDVHAHWYPTLNATSGWLSDVGTQTATSLDTGHWDAQSDATYSRDDIEGDTGVTHATDWKTAGTVQMSLGKVTVSGTLTSSWGVSSAEGNSTGSTRDDWTYSGHGSYTGGDITDGHAREAGGGGTITAYNVQSHWDTSLNGGKGGVVANGSKTTGVYRRDEWTHSEMSSSFEPDLTTERSVTHDVSWDDGTTMTQTLVTTNGTTDWAWAFTTHDNTFTTRAVLGTFAQGGYTFTREEGLYYDEMDEAAAYISADSRTATQSFAGHSTLHADGRTTNSGSGVAKDDTTHSYYFSADGGTIRRDQIYDHSYYYPVEYQVEGGEYSENRKSTSWTLGTNGSWEVESASEVVSGDRYRQGNRRTSYFDGYEPYPGTTYTWHGWSDTSYQISGGYDATFTQVNGSVAATGGGSASGTLYGESEEYDDGSNDASSYWSQAYSDVWLAGDEPMSSGSYETSFSGYGDSTIDGPSSSSGTYTTEPPAGIVQLFVAPYPDLPKPYNPRPRDLVSFDYPSVSTPAEVGIPPDRLTAPIANPVPPPPPLPPRPLPPQPYIDTSLLGIAWGLLMGTADERVQQAFDESNWDRSLGTGDAAVEHLGFKGGVGGVTFDDANRADAASNAKIIINATEAATLAAAAAPLITSGARKLMTRAGAEAMEIRAGATAAGKAASGEAVEVAESRSVSLTDRVLNNSCFVAGTLVLLGDRTIEIVIESIHVGDRVATDGGVANSPDGQTSAVDPNATEVDPATWRLVTISTSDGDWQVEALLPAEWLSGHGVMSGTRIDLSQIVDLKEMGVPEGVYGTVESVGACPGIEDGPGRVVLTTVTHLNSDVYDLTLTDSEGASDTIGVTGTHRVYSEDRGWIEAADLLVGESIRGEHGTLIVASLAGAPGAFRVYNMIVEGDHVYYVGESNALVHNTCSKLRRALEAEGEVFDIGDEAAHIIPKGMKSKPPFIQDSIDRARAVLDRFNISIDDAMNGFKAKKGHLGSHSDEYLGALGDALEAAEKDGVYGVLKTLNELKGFLANGGAV